MARRTSAELKGSREEGAPGSSRLLMPAEWERHEATWIAWPHNERDWPGKLEAIHWVYGEIVRRLAEGEQVRILVHSAEVARRARSTLKRVGVDPSRFELVRCPSDRGWLRDTGPIFVRASGPRRPLVVAGFHFNAWARYRNWRQDAQISAFVAARLGLPHWPVREGRRVVVLEGGAIDVNGRGTLITTEECLLDTEVQVRNPGMERTRLEQLLQAYLGVKNVLWLGRGIAGDDTHGHVDDLCRFVGPRTVVLCSERNASDANYHLLAENRERLQGARLEDGSKLEVVELPMPAPVVFDGVRLPASYANFYIGNAAVLVPTFNDPNDRVALGVLAEVITDRPVIGIHAVDLVWGLGTLHCLTQQQPAVDAAST